MSTPEKPKFHQPDPIRSDQHYNTSAGGLGTPPTWLAPTAKTTFVPRTTTTSFPTSPSDGDEFIYPADTTNGVFWRFRYYSAGSYWAFNGGPPLVGFVDTSEATTSTSYANLATTGPSVVLPFAADWDIRIECDALTVSGDYAIMSYAIGGTGAADADSILNTAASSSVRSHIGRQKRQTGLSAVTLTAKYRSFSGGAATFTHRLISVTPVKK